MSNYDIKIDKDELIALFSKKEALGELLTNVVNQVLESQMDEHLGAERYEHNNERQGYRNGYRLRQLYTRVGALTLRVPQTRDGSFSTDLFKRYQRHEQAFVLGLMEMYLQGVSTRKVTKVTEELCGVSFSKSTVSQLCLELDARLKAWRSRSLSTKRYPFIIVDALVVDIKRDEAIRSSGILIAHGVTEDGVREPLDLLVADSESESSWDELFKNLKQRGLKGVDLIISDQHAGLVKAAKRNFQGASWQRCQVHFMRNILGATPRSLRKEISSQLKIIFTAQDKKTARKLSHDLIEQYETKLSKAMNCLENGLESSISVLELPVRYQKKLRTSNLAERVNEEIRRRQRVLRIFPNDESAMRIIGALLADLNDKWHMASKYFDMREYWDWKQEQSDTNTEASNIFVIS
jgi:putative transposase